MINTNNNIFYHLFCVEDSVEKFYRTYKKIIKSGLIDNISNIYVNCVGVKKKDFGAELVGRDKVVVTYAEYDKSEEETLNLLRDFCINNTTGNVLYLHSKGILHRNNPNVQDWIDCMEFFLIEEYASCLSYLETYDTCGINLRKAWSLHYSGNFWWSRNSYVAKLDPCNTRIGCRIPGGRWAAELNFLKPGQSKYKEIYNYPQNSYTHPHNRNLYTNKEPLI